MFRTKLRFHLLANLCVQLLCLMKPADEESQFAGELSHDLLCNLERLLPPKLEYMQVRLSVMRC